MRNDVAFWLQQHCSVLPDTRLGAVLLRRGDALHLTAAWPTDQALPPAISQAATTALARGSLWAQPAPPGEDATPTPEFWIAQPLKASGLVVGAAVLVLAGRSALPAAAELTRLVESAERFGQVLGSPTTRKPSVPEDPSARVLELAAVAWGENRLGPSATAFTQALATRLGCDRVSLALKDGARTRLIAHSDGTVQAASSEHEADLLAAMDEAMDGQALIDWPLPDDAPPRIVAAHLHFARTHGLARVGTVPLVHRQAVVGALTLERSRDRAFDAPTLALLERLAAALAPWFSRLQAAEQPMHRRLAQGLGLVRGNDLPPQAGRRRLAGVAAAVLATAVLVWPTTREVKAPARLEGTLQRVLSAPQDGYLKQVKVRPGDTVARGDVLAALEGDDLQLERRQRLSEVEAAEAAAADAMAQHDRAQLAIQAAKAQALRSQLALLDQRIERAQVRAPFDAVVISGDLTQTLGAPVKKGDTLLTVAPSEGFRAIVDIEDADIAEVRTGQSGAMVLTAHPDQALPLHVERITPLAEARDGRNVFEVEVRLDADAQRLALRPGMQGYARLQLGRSFRARLWSQEVLAWLRLNTWRWMG